MSNPRAIPSWVQPGVEVVEERSGWNGLSYGSRHIIAKVHANGNFRVEGRDQQWRPSDNGRASRTGGDSWDRGPVLVRVTPELEAEIAHSHKLAIARDILAKEAKRLEHLSRLRSGDADAEVLAAAEAIASPSTRIAAKMVGVEQ